MRSICLLAFTIGTAGSLFAAGITVDTTASANATFNNYGVSAGPFPWSDLGFTASSSVMGGALNVATGGSTSYTLNTPVTGAEKFTPGATDLQLGYNSGWTGSLTSSPAAKGDLNAKFVYNIGPINGSATLFNAPLSAPAVNADLSASLNSGFGIPVLTSQSADGLGISTGLTLSAQAFCPFCVTVASVSLGFSVGTRIDQTVTATPFVTDGDLVWYTKTAPTYSSTDTFTTVTGGGGDVNNAFSDPGLSLASGDTFYMNILPFVELNMPVVNLADVAVPASISASWSVFGLGSSASYSGDLFTLSNGGESFDFNPTFYANFFYSQEIDFTQTCPVPGVPCTDTYMTPASSSGPTVEDAGLPADLNLLPPITVVGGGATPGGYGDTNPGALFKGDPTSDPICDPAGGDCINQVTLQESPEPDDLIFPGAGLLLIACGVRRRFGYFRT